VNVLGFKPFLPHLIGRLSGGTRAPHIYLALRVKRSFRLFGVHALLVIAFRQVFYRYHIPVLL
jgi:hypothetical protein